MQKSKSKELDDDYDYEKLQSATKKLKTEKPLVSPLMFQVLKKFRKARASILSLPHGEVSTPVYMPVGTKGTIKGLTSKQMEDLGCKILLGNTYHLALRPSGDMLEKFGGLHKFMNWKYNILTDSGGFQMVSLSKLCEINEEGVKFTSPFDSTLMSMRPEDSMKIQNQIGSDIMMALDDVVKTTTQGPRMGEAQERTTRWLQRCNDGHKRKDVQNLFGIVQGGVDLPLRRKSLDDLIAMDLPGYAIGGLAGGEDKEDFWKVVDFCTTYLPEDKPRYLMGVGYPVDLVVCSCLGVDMFDCVFPTRTARFGTALTKYGFHKLVKPENANDYTPIEEGCDCPTCTTYTRAYLYSTIGKEEVACHLITTHNIYYLLNLMGKLRESIINGTLENFVNDFLEKQFHKEKVIPKWVNDAMVKAGIHVKVHKISEVPMQIEPELISLEKKPSSIKDDHNGNEPHKHRHHEHEHEEHRHHREEDDHHNKHESRDGKREESPSKHKHHHHHHHHKETEDKREHKSDNKHRHHE